MFSGVRLFSSRSVGYGRRMFSNPAHSPNLGTKNAVMAITMTGFVGLIYYTAINKMRDDDLDKVIREKEIEKSL